MDPNPSSFLPLFSDLYNSANLSTITYIYHLSLSKLPPTSDSNYYQYATHNKARGTAKRKKGSVRQDGEKNVMREKEGVGSFFSSQIFRLLLVSKYYIFIIRTYFKPAMQ